MIEKIIKTFFCNDKKKGLTVIRTTNQASSKIIKRTVSKDNFIEQFYNFDEREKFFKRVLLLEDR